MKLKSRNKNLKRIVLFTVGAMLIVACILVVFEKLHITDFIKISPQASGPSASEKKLADKDASLKKESLILNSDKDGEQDASPIDLSSATLELSAQQEGDTSVTVFTKLKGYSDGECTLSIKNQGNVKTYKASVMYQPEYSTCSGYSIPIEQSGKGSWDITLSVESSGITKETTIKFEVK